MIKHTPGPWSTYVNTKDDTVIRKMFPDGQQCCEIARCKTGFANARLIAAAPELLEALISIAEESSDEGARACAMEAIAKATGGTT